MTGYFKAGNHLCKQFVPEDLPDGAPVSEMGDHFRKSRSHTQSAIRPSIQPVVRLSRQALRHPARQARLAGQLDRLFRQAPSQGHHPSA